MPGVSMTLRSLSIFSDSAARRNRALTLPGYSDSGKTIMALDIFSTLWLWAGSLPFDRLCRINPGLRGRKNFRLYWTRANWTGIGAFHMIVLVILEPQQVFLGVNILPPDVVVIEFVLIDSFERTNSSRSLGCPTSFAFFGIPRNDTVNLHLSHCFSF